MNRSLATKGAKIADRSALSLRVLAYHGKGKVGERSI